MASAGRLRCQCQDGLDALLTFIDGTPPGDHVVSVLGTAEEPPPDVMIVSFR